MTAPAPAYPPPRRPPASLGEPLEELRPGLENVVAGFILSGAMILAAVAIVTWLGWNLIQLALGNEPFGGRPNPWFWFSVPAVVAVGLAAGGGLLTRYVNGLRWRRVVVCCNGFYFAWKDRAEVVRWEEVRLVVETVSHARRRGYLICRRDGLEIWVNGDVIGNMRRFGQVLEERAALYGFAWQVIDPG